MNQSINTDSKNSKEPQQKYRLGTVSIKILGGFNFLLHKINSLYMKFHVMVKLDSRKSCRLVSIHRREFDFQCGHIYILNAERNASYQYNNAIVSGILVEVYNKHVLIIVLLNSSLIARRWVGRQTQ